MMKKLLPSSLLLSSVLIILACNAQAELVRIFPLGTLYGKLTAMDYPEVTISKTTLRLGAGSQIRTKGNLIVMPAMLTETGPIRYQLDASGFISRIWLLTPEEAEQAKAESKK
jgi:hypothetical protein